LRDIDKLSANVVKPYKQTTARTTTTTLTDGKSHSEDRQIVVVDL